MEDLANKEMCDSVPLGTEAVTQGCWNQKHAVLLLICAALVGLIVGLLASKVLDWISPDPEHGTTSFNMSTITIAPTDTGPVSLTCSTGKSLAECYKKAHRNKAHRKKSHRM